jgi:ABC-2 type transport system permease protein
MKVLIFILQKEFRQIFRDKTILAMMFAMPTIQLIILPLAMNYDVDHVNLVIVDHDHSTYSQRLISTVGASGYFRLIAADPSYQEALLRIEKEDADLIMEIPPGFERNLVREGIQKIGLSVDAINGTKAAIGGNYLRSVIADFSAGLDLNIQQSLQAGTPPGTIDITFSNWFNARSESKYYLVPGILVLLLTMIGGFMAALNIVREKETGTIEQINVTPIRKWEFILGKLIPFWVIGMVVFTVGLLVCRFVYGIIPEGSLALLYLFAGTYLTALLGFGLLISTFSDNQIQAMFVAFFFMTIFMLMGGLFTAVESMPAWARNISYLTPVTHFIRVVRMIILKGSSFTDVSMEYLYIVGFALVLNGWAIFNYRKTT